MATARTNKLIAFVFDDPYKAEEARAALHRMGGEGLLEIDETALVAKFKDGKTRVSQDVDVTAKGQKIGHLAGLVMAAVTGTFPFIIGGTLGGRLLGRLTDHGVTNKFIRGVTEELVPGTSALIILARSDETRRRAVLERLRAFGPKLLESDLPADVEQDLERALRAHQTGEDDVATAGPVDRSRRDESRHEERF